MIQVIYYILYLMLKLMIKVHYSFYYLILISITCLTVIILIIVYLLILIHIVIHLGGSCFGISSHVCGVTGLCSIGLLSRFLRGRLGVGLALVLVSELTVLSFMIIALFGYCTF